METSGDDLQERPRIADPDTFAQSPGYGVPARAAQLL